MRVPEIVPLEQHPHDRARMVGKTVPLEHDLLLLRAVARPPEIHGPETRRRCHPAHERVLFRRRPGLGERVADEDRVGPIDAGRVPEPVIVGAVVDVPSAGHGDAAPFDARLANEAEGRIGNHVRRPGVMPHVRRAPRQDPPHAEHVGRIAGDDGDQRGAERGRDVEHTRGPPLDAASAITPQTTPSSRSRPP
jgi:hypothetical protein